MINIEILRYQIKEYCAFDKNITSLFQKVDILKELYECADDVELMSGIGLENFIEGGYVPDTVAFFIFTQLKQSIKHDRFWYERADRPHPFTRGKHCNSVVKCLFTYCFP